MQTDSDQYRDLVLPIYNYAEADRLAGVSRGTSKRWLEGYKYSLGDTVSSRPPISTAGDRHELGGVSFVDLIEVIAISGLRRWYSAHVIRRIVAECEELFGTRYPLASHRFETDGRELYVYRDALLFGLLGRKWATAWSELLGPFLTTLDYRGDLAARWYPLGREESVVVDPEYGFGFPVVEGTGIRTEIVAELFDHEPVEEIAGDLGLSVAQVEDALRFELGLRKAA